MGRSKSIFTQAKRVPFGVKHRHVMIPAKLCGGLGCAQTDGLLDGCGQIIHQKVEVHLLLLPALFFRPYNSSGTQKRYEDKIKAAKKAAMDAKNNALQTEDISKGVFVPVNYLPKTEPVKAALPAAANQ